MSKLLAAKGSCFTADDGDRMRVILALVQTTDRNNKVRYDVLFEAYSANGPWRHTSSFMGGASTLDKALAVYHNTQEKLR